MPEIQVLNPGCCSDECLALSTSWLKFSGVIDPGSSVLWYLGDSGSQNASNTPLAYPVARKGRLKDFAVNIGSLVIPANGAIVFQLLRNGSPVSGFTITFTAGETGLKRVTTHGKKFHHDDTFDVQATLTNVGETRFLVSSTLGFEARL